MFRGPWNRGTSILAALVFVAMIGTVAMTISAISPSPSTALKESQLAEVGTAAQRGITELKDVASICDTKKKTAAASQQGTKQSLESGKGTEVTDDCVAAVFDTSKANARPNDPNSYKCVGKSANVSVDTAGTVSVKAAAAPGVAAGKCRTVACTPSKDGKNNNCINATLAGFSSAKINDYLKGQNPDVQPFSLSNDEAQKMIALDPRQTDALNDAFAEQQLSKMDQYQKNDSAIKQLEDQINSCAFGGGEGCDVQKLQSERDALTKQQAELKGQMDALAQARKDLAPEVTGAPDITLNCGTAENANNPRCYPGVPTKDPSGCPQGQINYGGACKSPATTIGPGGPAGPGGGAPDPGQSRGLGGFEQMLQGILKGLTQGLGKAAAGNNAPACASDPNLYAQQQQQYNQQLQQYNLQLQQYNMQQQYAQLNGLTPPPPPMAPQGCQQNQNSNTCPAAPAQPTGTCNGTWRPVTTQQSNGAQCTSSWQCVPTGATQPTAQISCQPLIADVGMSVAIAYTCGNSTGSQALGFDSNNATSGSTSTVLVAPPSGVNTATFGISCSNQGVVAKAECSVQIGKPSIVLVATPKIVPKGDKSNIGWITSGMKSCIISSPTLADFTAQNATNTSVSGAVTSPALTADTVFQLMCTTVGSSTRVASTTVLIATSTNP